MANQAFDSSVSRQHMDLGLAPSVYCYQTYCPMYDIFYSAILQEEEIAKRQEVARPSTTPFAAASLAISIPAVG
jgi:hypothetical protein